MRKYYILLILISIVTIFIGCENREDKEMVVGTDIVIEDITDFYYTKENINYDAYYVRYRFYVEDGKYMFFHETRERKGEYGPCTEEDTTMKGAFELSAPLWSKFTDLVRGGTVKKREETADAGGSGPWTFLYWKDDQSKYQQFSFDTYETEKKFEEFCVSLVPTEELTTNEDENTN